MSDWASKSKCQPWQKKFPKSMFIVHIWIDLSILNINGMIPNLLSGFPVPCSNAHVKMVAEMTDRQETDNTICGGNLGNTTSASIHINENHVDALEMCGQGTRVQRRTSRDPAPRGRVSTRMAGIPRERHAAASGRATAEDTAADSPVMYRGKISRALAGSVDPGSTDHGRKRSAPSTDIPASTRGLRDPGSADHVQKRSAFSPRHTNVHARSTRARQVASTGEFFIALTTFVRAQFIG